MTTHSNDRSFYPTVSVNIVVYLQQRGMTLKEIGKLMRLSESFISRVRCGKRSFTLAHLEQLERALGKPLSMILMEATPAKGESKELSDLYGAFRALMERLANAIEKENTGSDSNSAAIAS